MINLISIEERKKRVKDFYFRLIILFFVILSLCVFVASFAILPSYLISLLQKNSANQKLLEEKNKPILSLNKEIPEFIKNMNNKLSLIEKTKKDKFLVSERVINEIISKKMSDIKINQFTYKNDILHNKIISITGTAKSRERLLLFRNTLENDPLFSKIDLPISNFVKGSNIHFSLTLIPS